MIILKVTLLAASVIAVMTMAVTSTHAGEAHFLGDIILKKSEEKCPKGTIKADGRYLAISNHVQLFHLYGTDYGGNGITHFAIPNLRNWLQKEATHCVVIEAPYPPWPHQSKEHRARKEERAKICAAYACCKHGCRVL